MQLHGVSMILRNRSEWIIALKQNSRSSSPKPQSHGVGTPLNESTLNDRLSTVPTLAVVLGALPPGYSQVVIHVLLVPGAHRQSGVFVHQAVNVFLTFSLTLATLKRTPVRVDVRQVQFLVFAVAWGVIDHGFATFVCPLGSICL